MDLRPDPLMEPMDWDAGGHVHNWQTHIGPRVRKLWQSLDDATKILLAANAQDCADNEEWD